MKRLVGCALLIGCLIALPGAVPTLSATAEQHPTVVTIVRPGTRDSALLPPLVVTIANPRRATVLYRNLIRLKPFPARLEGAYCPLDTGVQYILTFRRADRVVLTAVADPAGCDSIQVSPGVARWGGGPNFAAWGPAGNPFWMALARDLNMPKLRDLWESPS